MFTAVFDDNEPNERKVQVHVIAVQIKLFLCNTYRGETDGGCRITLQMMTVNIIFTGDEKPDHFSKQRFWCGYNM